MPNGINMGGMNISMNMNNIGMGGHWGGSGF